LLLRLWSRWHRGCHNTILLPEPLSLFGYFGIPLLAGFLFIIQHLLDASLLFTFRSLAFSLFSFNHLLQSLGLGVKLPLRSRICWWRSSIRNRVLLG
jgi:hypothetical protein